MKFACICSPGTHRVQVSSSQNHIPPHSIISGISDFFFCLQMWECQGMIYCGPQELLSYLQLVLATMVHIQKSMQQPLSNLITVAFTHRVS